MKRFAEFLVPLVLAVSATSLAGQGKVIPLLDSERMVSLDGTWKFKLLNGKPILPERFDEPEVVLDGQPGAADTVFFRPGFDISSWSDIKVPGCWEMQGFSEPTYGVVPSQAGLYKREFTVPSGWDGGRLFVRFKGVLYFFRVWINGIEAGRWYNSSNAVSFDISPFVRAGEKNEIAVRVDTRSPYYLFDKFDNWSLSGIFRSVDLTWFPDTFIDDCYVRTKVLGGNRGLVEAELSLEGKSLDGHSVSAKLFSPSGRQVSARTARVAASSVSLGFTVPKAELWSAETPSLYSLIIELRKGGKTVQTIRKKVGIREIEVKDGVLLLNGKPLKLHGVNSHDLVPETGKTVSLESLRRDVKMWKEGNVNFLRGCHYAQDERKLELCDSAGIYVLDEVSFHFWRQSDTVHADNLVSRAEATVLRDRSHPCVIIWGIGNENEICSGSVKAAQKAKELDPTRLIAFAGTHGSLPDIADLYCRHYPAMDDVVSWKSSGKPFLATEYAHSLGLAFGSRFPEVWKTMFNRPDMAGGAVWHFQDQGIVRESVLPVDRSVLTTDVWTSPTRYLAASMEGCDGVVYADRTPQADWWLVKDTYSPVQIIEKRLDAVPGENLAVNVYNQYDFLDLCTLSGRWTLYRNRTAESSGPLSLSCAPHDTVAVVLPVRVPENPGKDVWTLKTEFTDAAGREVYEHEISLTSDETLSSFKQDIIAALDSGAEGSVLDLVPLVRTGRVPMLADVTVRDRHFGGKDYYWDPFLFKANDVEVSEEDGVGRVRATYWRNYPYVTERLDAEYSFHSLGGGAYDMEFNVVPVTATGYFLEAGVSWALPEEASVFRWIGNGPYPVWPDKAGNGYFGIHEKIKGDLDFNGNRTGVQVAVVTDAKGNGLAILADGADISAEVLGGRIYLSYNSLVAGVGHKKTIGAENFPAGDVESFGGRLTVVPLREGCWPEPLERVFGNPAPGRAPVNPFWYSYDWTM
ncbi:MAG: hypothetical protein IJL61_02665 [Bacteroidales bacterium]|nr:hypothetical protein [Bacteroidales bacterium]